MFGLREAGVVGASVVLAGGVAYLVWSYASSPTQRKLDTQPGEDGGSSREEEREKKVPVEETVVPAEAPTTATVKSRPADSAGTQVLVLGLDGAGKTSLLHCFSSGSLEQDVEPTQGFNAVSLSRDDLHVEFLEIGGKENLRPYWQRYLSKALLLVFVVDSSDPERFALAKKHLHTLLGLHPSLPLMVLANKQDLSGSCTITDLHDALSLSEAGDRRMFLIGTHVRKGDPELSSGVQDARDLIFQMVSGDR
ncbi:ADP-ribosylation factor-like protein 9 isoform X1 [Fundulus heteroclitus]|uniref:ADP-ribosylation factor-like protein 9 isoform X1 n=1 Tax=Fundulus heteroclitus TaxID=8078 RepID=UPI00165ABDFC|nr:ADP-ribosylation factor-like protein 9 isoform X1 [Fundulus heteroclitus]